ncbi:Hypothetical protein A7982_04188 [Minicystis rosea]|nr:Hypothetical protein A7982_04188 [Minicystis rosea]
MVLTGVTLRPRCEDRVGLIEPAFVLAGTARVRDCQLDLPRHASVRPSLAPEIFHSLAIGVGARPGAAPLVINFTDASCSGDASCGVGAHGGLLPALYVSVEEGKTYDISVVSADATAPKGSFTLRLGNKMPG